MALGSVGHFAPPGIS